MKVKTLRTLFPIYLVLVSFLTAAQMTEEEKKAIIAEGYLLYRLELASWNSSDLLSTLRSDRIGTLDSIRGYLSYRQGNSYNTIFFGGENNTRVYANFVFDSLLTIETSIKDLTTRNTTSKEKELVLLRQMALEHIAQNDKNYYQAVENTSFNLIPLIEGKTRRVIVLTAPHEYGNVLFGNDYVLEYAGEKLKSQTRLHRDLITVPMEAEADSGSVVVTVHAHSHPTSDFITSTDICTLLLHQQYTNWKQHYVISDKFVTIWEMDQSTFEIISRKAFDKIYESREKKQ